MKRSKIYCFRNRHLSNVSGFCSTKPLRLMGQHFHLQNASNTAFPNQEEGKEGKTQPRIFERTSQKLRTSLLLNILYP